VEETVEALDAVPPEDRERTDQTIAECIANQAPYRIEISLRHARQYWRDGFGRSTGPFTTRRASRIALKLTPNNHSLYFAVRTSDRTYCANYETPVLDEIDDLFSAKGERG
jgi:hypothetical protein